MATTIELTLDEAFDVALCVMSDGALSARDVDSWLVLAYLAHDLGEPFTMHLRDLAVAMDLPKPVTCATMLRLQRRGHVSSRRTRQVNVNYVAGTRSPATVSGPNEYWLGAA